MIDYLIVGAGLYGSVCARQLTDIGYKCLVIDKRNHIGGNCYTEEIRSRRRVTQRRREEII